VQSVPLEKRVTPAPARVAHRARLGLVPHAARQRERCLRRQHVFHVVAVEPGLGDKRVREAVPCGKAGDPARLADRVQWIPLRLDVHALEHAAGLRIREEVRGQVILAQRPRVAVAEVGRGLVLEPRIAPLAQVPEMMMGVEGRNQACAVSGAGL